jgi:hypothetical protein
MTRLLLVLALLLPISTISTATLTIEQKCLKACAARPEGTNQVLCTQLCQQVLSENLVADSNSNCGLGNFSCSGSCLDSHGKVTPTNSDEIEMIRKIQDSPFVYVYEASGFNAHTRIPSYVSETYCSSSPHPSQFPLLQCQEFVDGQTVLKEVEYDSCDSFAKVIRKSGPDGVICRVKCARTSSSS